jgi:hypothetical protein
LARERLGYRGKVAQEEAMNITKQQQHSSQLAVELEDLSWRWALKLAELDRREHGKQTQRSR